MKVANNVATFSVLAQSKNVEPYRVEIVKKNTTCLVTKCPSCRPHAAAPISKTEKLNTASTLFM